MTYYTWFIVFAVVAYFIVTDESVAAAFYYVSRLGKSYVQRQWWWIKNNPRTPWAKYIMWRRSNQLAKELMKELESKNK
jgi:hypothetical protein